VSHCSLFGLVAWSSLYGSKQIDRIAFIFFKKSMHQTIANIQIIAAELAYKYIFIYYSLYLFRTQMQRFDLYEVLLSILHSYRRVSRLNPLYPHLGTVVIYVK